MAETDIGFKIHGKFYPLIPRDDWTVDETRACRKVAGMPLDKLVEVGDHYMINVTFATASWWRGNPLASETEVLTAVGALKAADIEFIGGQPDDASPPEETPGAGSSESTEPSSDPTQGNTDPQISGTPDSPTGSTSGPQSPSGDSPTDS